jgi:Spy/CpxP family protein refolding chaperone
LRNSYSHREDTYITESKGYLDQIEKYQKIIADSKVNAVKKLDSEYFNMSKKLKNEIHNLKEQIKLKDEIIGQLKDIENSDKRKERKDLRQTLDRFKEVIKSVEFQMKEYVKTTPDMNEKLLKLNVNHYFYYHILYRNQVTKWKKRYFNN